MLNPHLRIYKLQSISSTLPGKSPNSIRTNNAPKSQQNDLGTFLAPISTLCWTPFGINFLYISCRFENCCFATVIMRNANFYFPFPFILGQLFKIRFVSMPRSRTPFFHQFSNMMPKHISGPITYINNYSQSICLSLSIYIIYIYTTVLGRAMK